jgi:choline dehydrogenase-like flavoprotein
MDLGFAHVMGTCRMGERDDGTCVTDGFGRVWDTENLYLTTVGLIPTALAINPTLTGAALAIRTADHVAEPRQ